MLHTKRLRLRLFDAADATEVQRLVDDPGISRATAAIPSPYHLHHAQEWLASHAPAQERGEGRPWAILRASDGVLVGAVGLEVAPTDALGRLGYWLGRPYWGCGYMTEAARSVVSWGFNQGLAKIAAEVLADNHASVKVLQRCGLRLEGVLRSHAQRDAQRIDVLCMGCLRGEAQTP